MNKKISLQLANILGFAGTLMIKGLANSLPINNKTTGELSNQYPNLFVPAAITFAIWGVIYLLLLFFIIYQARDLFSKEKKSMPFLDQISWLFFISSLANMGWIFAWHYELVALSVLIMLVILGSLILIYKRLGIGKEFGEETVSNRDKYLVHLPFSVYLGWITIATFANIITFLVDIDSSWFLSNQILLTILVIILATVITAWVLLRYNDIFYSAVIVWAFIGIIIKQTGPDRPLTRSLIVTVIICLALISLGIILRLKKWRAY